jgi:hypothetical protein
MILVNCPQGSLSLLERKVEVAVRLCTKALDPKTSKIHLKVGQGPDQHTAKAEHLTTDSACDTTRNLHRNNSVFIIRVNPNSPHPAIKKKKVSLDFPRLSTKPSALTTANILLQYEHSAPRFRPS